MAKTNTTEAPMTMDCVYYWIGGRESGKWRQAQLVSAALGGTAKTLEELRQECIRGGRVALLGSSTIGAPEGVPSDERFQEVNRTVGQIW